MYQVLVDDVALKLVVPSVMEVLLPDEVADVDVAELGCLRQGGAHRRLASPWGPSHQNVRPPPLTVPSLTCHLSSSPVYSPTPPFRFSRAPLAELRAPSEEGFLFRRRANKQSKCCTPLLGLSRPILSEIAPIGGIRAHQLGRMDRIERAREQRDRTPYCIFRMVSKIAELREKEESRVSCSSHMAIANSLPDVRRVTTALRHRVPLLCMFATCLLSFSTFPLLKHAIFEHPQKEEIIQQQNITFNRDQNTKRPPR